MENYIWMNRLNVLSQSLKKYDVAMKLKIINKRRFNDKWIKIIKKNSPSISSFFEIKPQL